MSLWCTRVRLHGARGHPPGRSQSRLSGSLKHSPLPLSARRLMVRANIPHGNYRTYSECLATKKLSHVSREVTQKSNKPSPTLNNPAVNSRRCATLHQSQHIPLAAEAGNLCDAIKGERGPFLRNCSVSAFCSAISVRAAPPGPGAGSPWGCSAKAAREAGGEAGGVGPASGFRSSGSACPSQCLTLREERGEKEKNRPEIGQEEENAEAGEQSQRKGKGQESPPVFLAQRRDIRGRQVWSQICPRPVHPGARALRPRCLERACPVGGP